MREEIRSPLPLITIVICTYNRAYILGECLRSLQAQTLPTCFFNIIIVDNDSNDATQALVKDFSHDWPQLKFIIEKKRGAGNARNAALRKVTTDWVACLDSDAKAHPDWLATVLETIKNDDFDAFGGPYYAWHFFGAPPKWFPKDFGTYEAAQSYGPLSGANHIPGGNCAFKLSAAQAVGCFPVDIGMTGKKCAYGEETLMFDRMKAAGFRLGYVPAMKIDHCVLPYKYSFFWQIKSAFARGRGLEQVAPQQHRHALMKLFYMYLKGCWLTAKDAIAPNKEYSWRAMVLQHFFTPVCYTGIIFEKIKKVLCKWRHK